MPGGDAGDHRRGDAGSEAATERIQKGGAAVMPAPKGWWRASLRLETLQKLEKIGEKIEEKIGKKPSIDAVVRYLIDEHWNNA